MKKMEIKICPGCGGSGLDDDAKACGEEAQCPDCRGTGELKRDPWGDEEDELG